MRFRVRLVGLAVAPVFLGFANPDREPVTRACAETGGPWRLAGAETAGLLSSGPRAGIRRGNSLFAGRFHPGGDGVLPRKDLTWGIAGRFIDIKERERYAAP